MPPYQFGCRTCGLFELDRPASESSDPAPCPICGRDDTQRFYLFGLRGKPAGTVSQKEEEPSRPGTLTIRGGQFLNNPLDAAIKMTGPARLIAENNLFDGPETVLNATDVDVDWRDSIIKPPKPRDECRR